MRTIAMFIVSLIIAISAFAAQAFFTGRQETVTTVTYQLALRCEYSYLGQKFWRVFKNSCPSTVEVE